MNTQKLRHNPPTKYKEIVILRSLGLREDEIRYLARMKEKQQIRSKWNKTYRE